MKNFKDKVAVITGAGSGIGRALALELGSAGAKLALSDINEAGLKETADQLGLAEDRLMTRKLDVADRQAFYDFADDVVNHFGYANMIFNNAGVALGATVEDMNYDDFEWLMNINFWGVVYGTKAFLPYLKEAGEGHIINISSIFGLVGIPTQSAYNAAKFAVRGFTESLRIELEMENSPVSCTSVHPGGIKTNIAKSARFTGMQELTGMDEDTGKARFEKMFITTPDKAAATILKAVKRNARRVLIGPDAHAIDWMARVAPTGYQALVRRSTKYFFS